MIKQCLAGTYDVIASVVHGFEVGVMEPAISNCSRYYM
jgi:hypothetical protein